MRLKLLTVVTVLLLVGPGNARPQKTATSESPQPDAARGATKEWRPVPDPVEPKSGDAADGVAAVKSRYSGRYVYPCDGTDSASRRDRRIRLGADGATSGNRRRGLDRESRLGEATTAAGGTTDRGYPITGNEYDGNPGSGEYPCAERTGGSPLLGVGGEQTGVGSNVTALNRASRSSDLDSAGPIRRETGDSREVEIRRPSAESRTLNYVKIAPQRTEHAAPILENRRPAAASTKGKVTNYVNILPGYGGSRRNWTKPSLHGADREDEVEANESDVEADYEKVVTLEPHVDAYSTYIQNLMKHSTSSGILAEKEGSSSFARWNFTGNRIRIKPSSTHSMPDLPVENWPASMASEDKTVVTGDNAITSKNRVKLRPDSSLVPGLNLKNWPDEGLQNIQDLFDYEKYTSFHDQDDSQVLHEMQNKPSSNSNRKPPVLVFENSRPPEIPTRVKGPGVITIYDPVSVPLSEPGFQEIDKWLKVPPFASNQSYTVDEYSEKPLTNNFESVFANFEPNRPQRPITSDFEPVVENLGSGGPPKPSNAIEDDPVSEQEFFESLYGSNDANNDSPQGTKVDDEPIYIPVKTKRPIYKPTSQVSQNMVVHILNPNPKKPNVTLTETKVPQKSKITSSNGSTASPKPVTPSNVRVTFVPQKNEEQASTLKQQQQQQQQQQNAPIPEVMYNDCPTILINSYTKVNNTVQGKEGCTDLNIVINSHVLSTNVFNPSTSPDVASADDKSPSQPQSDYVQNDNEYYLNNGIIDKYGTSYHDNPTAKPGFSSGSYGAGNYDDSYGASQPSYDPGSYQDNYYTDKLQNPIQGTAEDDEPAYEVFQNTDIEVDQTQSLAPPNVLSDSDAAAGDSIAADPVSDVAPVAMGPAAVPADAAAPVGNAIAPAGTAASGSLPSIPNFGGTLSALPGLVGNVAGGNGGSAGAGGLADDDDDDDDNDFELTPVGLLDSMTSFLTYFTFLNPLNYGFYGLTLAPLAVVAAGVFGIAAVMFPWAFPEILDFGRAAADKVTIRFRPSLEEVVKQSVHKYRNWNDWKSKRKKRKR